MKNNLDLSLYLVTDSTYHTEESLLYTVEEACKGGVTHGAASREEYRREGLSGKSLQASCDYGPLSYSADHR